MVYARWVVFLAVLTGCESVSSADDWMQHAPARVSSDQDADSAPPLDGCPDDRRLRGFC